MTFRTSLCLLLAASCWLFPSVVAAQAIPVDHPLDGPARQASSPNTQPSHRPISDGLTDFDGAEELLRQRFEKRQELEEFRDLSRQLMDRRVVEDLRKHLSPEALEGLPALRDKLQSGGDVSQDPTWRRLLEAAQKSGRFSPQTVQFLKKWANARAEESFRPFLPWQPPREGESSGGATPPVISGPQPSPPGPPKPADSFAETREIFVDWFKKELTDGLKDALETVDDAIGDGDSHALRDTIRQFGRMELGEDRFGFNLADHVGGLGRFLPDLKGYVPAERLNFAEFASLFRGARLSGAPRSSGPGASLSGGSGSGLVYGMLWAVVLVILAVLLGTARSWYQKRATGADAWRLGPWPVNPRAVATRDELIRAFEYLAFLTLGREARTCHHREVAERLAGQPDFDPARRGEAARHLARLYEEARYAPDSRPLSDEEWAAARRDLCFLAGVAHA